MNNYLDIAELVSSFLALPVLVICGYVVKLWSGPAWRAIRESGLRNMGSRDLFICGVLVGFVGETTDNLYWSLAWAAEMMGWESRGWLFEHGVIANIPFRQVTGLVAGYCHVLSALKHEDDVSASKAKRILVVSAVASAWLLFLMLSTMGEP